MTPDEIMSRFTPQAKHRTSAENVADVLAALTAQPVQAQGDHWSAKGVVHDYDPEVDGSTFYDLESVDNAVHAVTHDEGEDDSVTVLERVALALENRFGGASVWEVFDRLEAATAPAVDRGLPEPECLGKIRSALEPRGRFKPTPGEWVADDHQGWAHPMTEVRTDATRDEGGHSIVRVRADFTCTVGKSEYEWANAAFVAACSPQNIRALLAYIDALAASAPSQAEPNSLLEWACWRWREEVQDRPLVNVHRRTLDDTWRQVVRHAGGDPEALLGPSHDTLISKGNANG